MNTIYFENLKVWQDSTDIAAALYQQLKDHQPFSMKDHMQRTTLSIASNINKFFERRSQEESIQFLYTALEFCMELKSQLQIAQHDQLLLTEVSDLLQERARQISAMLYKLIHNKRTAMHPLYNPLYCMA